MNGEPRPSIPNTLLTPFRSEMAFPYLTKEMVERLKGYGTEESFPPEAALWSRGDREVDMFVVLKGTVEVYAVVDDGIRQSIATLHEQQFTGELDLLANRRSLVDCCTITECSLLRVGRSELQRLIRSEGDIANLILQATIYRRLGMLQRAETGIVLLGRSDAAETIQLQRFLIRNNYPHRLWEPTDEQPSDEASTEFPEQHLLPAVILPDGRVMQRPGIAELADELGMTEVLDPKTIYDIAVVGAGPAGLAAAVSGASEGLSTIVLEGIAPGGQAGTSSKIENYLGFPTGVSGHELADRAQVQAQKFGARLAIARDVTGINSVDGIHVLMLAGGAAVRARSVVIATGAQYRKLNVEDYGRFEGQGIQYAATAMEAQMCREREVAVIGGGNSAGQATVYLSGIASHVHLVIRRASLAETMSQYLISRIENSPRITLHADSEIERLDGETVLRSATWINRETGERETREIGSMFVMIGAEPNTGWLYGTVTLNNKGFIITGGEEAFENTRYATNVPGIYAVGDVRAESVKRVASAVGEGSIVISDIHRYLATHPAFAPEGASTLAAL
jgi:thioredoxin reductase (NADPH)